jgi:DNA-binding MarR family transcriptional regulator
MFNLLLQTPGQTVSAVAQHLRLPLSLTSEYLRALEARGLLQARRLGRWVEYRLPVSPDGQPAARLVSALRKTFQQEAQPVETIFKSVTAFTHPRRLDIFRLLQTGPRRVGQIRAATGLSRRALLRHLTKLKARGFVSRRRGLYAVVKRRDRLGAELARLAAE